MESIRNSTQLAIFVEIICHDDVSLQAVRLAGLGVAAYSAQTSWVLEVGKPQLDGRALGDLLMAWTDTEDELETLWESRKRSEIADDEFDAKLSEIVRRLQPPDYAQ